MDWMGLVIIKITSSANKLILWSVPLWGITVISGSDLILDAKGSISRAKISGERGHPCCVPLVILKGVERVPPVSTIADGLEYKDRITA